jgi:uncharacterized protein YkwD
LKKYFTSILFLVISVLLFSQQKVDDVDYEYSAAFLEGLVQEQIDVFRKSKNLPDFKKDEILTAAAVDQTTFIAKDGKVSHEQPSAKKETPFKRVMSYDGMHGKVGENCFKLIVGTTTKLPEASNKIKLKSYQNVASAIAQGWIHSEDGSKILSDLKYVNYGISIAFNEKDKSIVATHVVGYEPFVLPDGVNPMRDDFGVLPYDKSKCTDLDKKYAYLPELMSDNIFFKNGEIYFYFHDLELFKNILSESGDGIAIDIILRDQFDCGSGNKIYPSKIHKGVMLPPISKSHLFGENELKEKNEIEVSLGLIPDYVDTNNVEFNLLMIKSNCLCQTVVYNSLGGENLKSLDLNFMLDTLSVSSRADSVLNQLAFTVPFERNKSQYNSEDIKPFLDSISLNRFDLKKIEVIAYSSIEGDEKQNKVIQERRAKSILAAIKKYKLQDVETKITTKENLKGFYESIKGSPYEEELTKLSREDLLKVVNSDTLKINLEPYLEETRKAQIILYVEKVFMDEALFKALPEWFEKALKEKDYVKAKVYQSVMLKNVENGNIGKDKILGVKIPHTKETVPFINNQIALRWYYSKAVNKDSLHQYLMTDIQTQLVIDPTNAFLLYNKSVLRLLLWSNDYKRETDPRLVLREIRLLGSSNIEKWMINRLVLNYNIISADYFYDNKKFNEREKALVDVKKALFSSNLDRNQSFRIANYFMFQLRIDWAIDIMKPFADKKNIDEEFLFTFLTVAIYSKEKIPENEFENYLNRAKQMNKERFCKLFGYPNMSFQLLHNTQVKSLYCETCN